MSRSRVVIDIGEDTCMVITPQFNQDFVNAIKALPGEVRRWNGDAQAWIVDNEYGDQVEEMVKQHYGEAPVYV